MDSVLIKINQDPLMKSENACAPFVASFKQPPSPGQMELNLDLHGMAVLSLSIYIYILVWKV